MYNVPLVDDQGNRLGVVCLENDALHRAAMDGVEFKLFSGVAPEFLTSLFVVSLLQPQEEDGS